MSKNQKKHIQDGFLKFVQEQHIHNLGMQGFSSVEINNNRPIMITNPTGELLDFLRDFDAAATAKTPKKLIEMAEKDKKGYIREAFVQTIRERRIRQGGLSIFMSILQRRI